MNTLPAWADPSRIFVAGDGATRYKKRNPDDTEGGAYALPLPTGDGGHDGGCYPMSRASDIVGLRDNKFVLDQWKQVCKVDGIAVDPSLVMTPRMIETIKRMTKDNLEGMFMTPATEVAAWREMWAAAAQHPDVQERTVYVGDWKTKLAIADRAHELAGGNVGRDAGHHIHAASEQYDRGVPLEEVCQRFPLYDREIRAYAKAKQVLGFETNTKLIERVIANTQLGQDLFDKFGYLDPRTEKPYVFGGTFDRIVRYQGRLVVLDLKSGKDVRKKLVSIANQMALYAYAAGMFNYQTDGYDPMPDELDREIAYILHVPFDSEQSAAELIPVDIRKAWEESLPECARAMAEQEKSYNDAFLVGEAEKVAYPAPPAPETTESAAPSAAEPIQFEDATAPKRKRRTKVEMAIDAVDVSDPAAAKAAFKAIREEAGSKWSASDNNRVRDRLGLPPLAATAA